MKKCLACCIAVISLAAPLIASASTTDTASYPCGAKSLTSAQLSLLTDFDAQLASLGDAYSLESNRQAVLGNSEPAVLEAYLNAYQATNDTRYLQHFIIHGDRVLGHRDDHAGYRNYRGISGATWSDGHYSTGGQYISYLIEDGSLIGGLAHFAAIVKKNTCLQTVTDLRGRTFLSIADSYAAEAAQTVAFHSENWHTGTVNSLNIGYYTTPTDATFVVGEIPGKPVPLNYQSAIGSAVAYLYVATNNSSYLDRARRIANYVLLEMNYNSSADAYSWHLWPQMVYWPGAGHTQYSAMDDLSHSILTADFARVMYENNLGVFYGAELGRIAHAYSRVMYSSSTSLPLFIDGTGPSAGKGVYQFGNVAALTPYDSSLWTKVYAIMITNLHTNQVGNWVSTGAFTGHARLIQYAPTPPLTTTLTEVSPGAGANVMPGDTIVYRISYSIGGIGDQTGVYVYDTIPSFTTLAALIGGTDAYCSATNCPIGLTAGYDVWWEQYLLHPGYSSYNTISVKVAANAPNGSQICNTARIYSEQVSTKNSNQVCNTVTVPPPPPPPTNLSKTCNTDGTSVTLQWNAVPSATAYPLRLDYRENNAPSCGGGWLCAQPPDFASNTITQTSYTATITPGKPYFWWIHSIVGGIWSAGAGGSVFTCAAATTSTSITHSLALGWTGEEVSALQKTLKQFGVFKDDITGYFGSITEQAVKQFQLQNNLAAVGIVGPQTRSLLQRLMGW